MLSEMETYIYTHMCIKLKRLCVKTLKCSRKLSHVPSGRALKCLSWPDGIPCLSLLIYEKVMEICACPRAGPLRNYQGIWAALLTLGRGWACHRQNWARQGQVTPKQDHCCIRYKNSQALIPQGAAGEASGCSIRPGTSQTSHMSQHSRAVGGTGTVDVLGPKPRPPPAAVVNTLPPWDADRS